MIKEITGILKTMQLVYQPIVDHREVVRKVEVLLRWDTKTSPTILNPEKLIEHAEQSPEAIKLIDSSVLNALVASYRRWQSCSDIEQLEQIVFSVNLSPKSIAYDDDFIEKFAKVLEVIPTQLLEIELLETRFTTDMEDQVHSNLLQLSEMGIKVSLDDFGNGFGCFNKMSWMAFDNVKLDGKLTGIINTSHQADLMISSIIKIARDIGADITAEKIESHAQFETLSKMGCKYFQGYYFSKPLSSSQLLEYIGRNLEVAYPENQIANL